MAAFSNSNAVSFLDQSTQHFDIGPYYIGSHIYVACLIATFVLFPLYPSRPIDSASCRPPSFWLSVLHSIYHWVAQLLLTYPCQITATTNVMNRFCTQYALFPCSFKYCQLLELCQLCCPHSAIHFAVVRQGYYNNYSKDLVVGCVSGVVVDKGGHAVWLPSVTLNVVVNGGCLLMRGSLKKRGFTVTVFTTCADDNG